MSEPACETRATGMAPLPGMAPAVVPFVRDAATLVDADDAAAWRAIGRHRFASLFTSRPWTQAIAEAYGLRLEISAQVHAGEVAAALPFCHVRDMRGERVLSLPFSDYADPLVDAPAAWQRLVAPLMARGVPVRLRCLHNSAPAGDTRFDKVGEALWHAVDLTRPEEAIWSALDGSARQNIRKAQRHGITIRAGRSLDDLRTFHGMHARLRKAKYGMLAQPFALFEALHAAFDPQQQITALLAEVDGTAIAGILFIESGDTLYYKFNASLDQRLRPNDLLVWEGIRLGQRRGLAKLDFGVSDTDQPGLIRYKEKFATEQGVVSTLLWQPPGYADPRGEQATRTLHAITRLVTDASVPDAITQAAGDELYRFFC
jgi:CelD/BcsL family acetyltransferase involved in cellulose biosynthesis